jgi:hypothetical protein
MVKQESPLSFRPSAQDSAILAYLKDKLGLGFSQIVKMAIRKLYEQEKRREK